MMIMSRIICIKKCLYIILVGWDIVYSLSHGATSEKLERIIWRKAYAAGKVGWGILVDAIIPR